MSSYVASPVKKKNPLFVLSKEVVFLSTCMKNKRLMVVKYTYILIHIKIVNEIEVVIDSHKSVKIPNSP